MSVATGCLLLGGSGAVVAANNCETGFLTGIIEEDVIVDGLPCVLRDANVSGKIQISNAPNATILSTKASGNIVVQDSAIVAIMASSARNILARRNDAVLVVGTLANKNLAVNRNVAAGVKQNGAVISITCVGNEELDARFNYTEGEDNCRR
jgi:hypothetical protein